MPAMPSGEMWLEGSHLSRYGNRSNKLLIDQSGLILCVKAKDMAFFVK